MNTINFLSFPIEEDCQTITAEMLNKYQTYIIALAISQWPPDSESFMASFGRAVNLSDQSVLVQMVFQNDDYQKDLVLLMNLNSYERKMTCAQVCSFDDSNQKALGFMCARFGFEEIDTEIKSSALLMISKKLADDFWRINFAFNLLFTHLPKNELVSSQLVFNDSVALVPITDTPHWYLPSSPIFC